MSAELSQPIDDTDMIFDQAAMQLHFTTTLPHAAHFIRLLLPCTQSIHWHDPNKTSRPQQPQLPMSGQRQPGPAHAGNSSSRELDFLTADRADLQYTRWHGSGSCGTHHAGLHKLLHVRTTLESSSDWLALTAVTWLCAVSTHLLVLQPLRNAVGVVEVAARQRRHFLALQVLLTAHCASAEE